MLNGNVYRYVCVWKIAKMVDPQVTMGFNTNVF